jgi:hypothetical protein
MHHCNKKLVVRKRIETKKIDHPSEVERKILNKLNSIEKKLDLLLPEEEEMVWLPKAALV